ncbi:MAG: M23 family metallopeptidase [Candidatus Rokubacteria bacterium]|nr:M23 family metallopeptidase [Candidatus Rokubacteria bacterium]
MSALRRRSRAKVLILVILLLLLAVVGTVSYLGWRQSIAGPSVMTPPPRRLGHKTTFPVVIEARRGNITAAEVGIVQDGRSTVVAKADGPPGARAELAVTVDSAALELREGEGTLVVRARDDFWRPLAIDERPFATFPVTLDFTPPQLEILAATRYVSNGGVGLVAFRVDGASSTDVTVGGSTAPSFPMGPPERRARVALVVLPWDLAPGAPIAVRARDDAGNVTTRGIPFELRPRQFPRDTIDVTNNFLQTKVPELLPQHPPSTPLIEGFLVLNRDQRRQAEEEKRRIAAKTADRPLWEGPFVQPRNTKVFANFAETRRYLYQGQEVDTQVHFGYDLASTKQAPVPAANKGVVVFAGPLTIYGNTVIVDHGIGLQTLYAHLSSISVKAGDQVDKGQELGRTGTTGLVLGDHLHYEVLVHGVPVTPVEWWDAKWMRDRINLPLGAAGLPEIAGLDASAAEDRAARPGRSERRRR